MAQAVQRELDRLPLPHHVLDTPTAPCALSVYCQEHGIPLGMQELGDALMAVPFTSYKELPVVGGTEGARCGDLDGRSMLVTREFDPRLGEFWIRLSVATR